MNWSLAILLAAPGPQPMVDESFETSISYAALAEAADTAALTPVEVQARRLGPLLSRHIP